jgi:ribosome recycling factor
MAHAILEQAQTSMEKAEAAFRRNLGQIRAGRANASLVNRVLVDYYGVPTALNQVASITIPEPRVLMITPYDKNALEDVEKAIYTADIGISPANDGSVIRLVIPQLTGERRKEIAKEVGKEAEGAKVAIRSARRDAMDSLKKAEKASEISEDEMHDLEKSVQDITDKATKVIDEIAKEKEKEITEG